LATSKHYASFIKLTENNSEKPPCLVIPSSTVKLVAFNQAQHIIPHDIQLFEATSEILPQIAQVAPPAPMQLYTDGC
jgi:hypothetical protein